MSKQLTDEKVKLIKEYVIDSIVEDYKYNIDVAKDMVEHSIFEKLLRDCPDYVLHYNIEEWAESIVTGIWR